MSEIYLDNNATTQPLPEVVETVASHLRETYGNPSSRHGLGRKARRVLEDSREQIASLLGAAPQELVFTSGGTEANNLAVYGLTSGPAGTIATSPGEHPSNLEACRVRERQGWKRISLPVDYSGLFDTSSSDWNGLSSNNVRLAAVILAHNETGVIQAIEPLVREANLSHFAVHLDGVQAVGKLPIHFRELGAHTLSFGAHKFHGPRGIGGLLIRDGVKLSADFPVGGLQETGRRAGTESVALVAGMAKALELWHQSQAERTARVTSLRDRLQTQLEQRAAPTVVNGKDAPRLPNTLNISFPGVDGEALLVALDLDGVCCSLGSACASGSIEPTPILVAMGLPPEVFKSALRITLSCLTAEAEVDEAARRIAEIVQCLR
ncbi:cysteine desulfurase family protein [Schlesneria paludicola]|uniref:cysteine desulfurase family protein n=1 Tax=Schlesneria paludicola TaxID=360056 RepID=UPI00029A6621|nr:cysteine desulfurase family protein [Schlesneria paludicola]